MKKAILYMFLLMPCLLHARAAADVTQITNLIDMLSAETQGTRSATFVSGVLAGKNADFIKIDSVEDAKNVDMQYVPDKDVIVINKQWLAKTGSSRRNPDFKCYAPILVHELLHASSAKALKPMGIFPVSDVKEEEVAFMETFIFIQEKLNQNGQSYYNGCKNNDFVRPKTLKALKKNGFAALKQSVSKSYPSVNQNFTAQGIKVMLTLPPSFSARQKVNIDYVLRLAQGDGGGIVKITPGIVESAQNIKRVMSADGTLSARAFFTEPIAAGLILVNRQDLESMAAGQCPYFNQYVGWRDKRFDETLRYFNKALRI